MVGGVSSTADDKSNGNLFVPAALETKISSVLIVDFIARSCKSMQQSELAEAT